MTSDKDMAGKIINSETQGLVSGGLNSVVNHQQFNLEQITAQSLGTAIGEQIGDNFKSTEKLADKQEKQRQAEDAQYRHSQQNRVNSQAGQNPGRNRSAMFAGSHNPNLSKQPQHGQSGITSLQHTDKIPSLSEVLKGNPNLSIVARGSAGAELYDRASGQYLVYDNASGIRMMDVGEVDSVHPVTDVLAAGGIGKVGGDIALYGLERFAPNTFRVLEVGAERLLGRLGLFGNNEIDGMTSEASFQRGEKVYRVWGDEAQPDGRSWTRTNPNTVLNYRNKAGLPFKNTGRFVSEGILTDTTGVVEREALPLSGNVGGLDELIIPNPEEQIELERVSGVNPGF